MKISKIIKQAMLIEDMKGRKMNKKGWVWLLAAVPAALAALVWGVNALSTPKADPNSISGIIAAVPIWGWIVMGLVLLVFLKS